MTDIINKIKIKKPDGSFTDYIPIGADAENVSMADGESVQKKINKKPYYYNSVAEMKADSRLKTGDCVITLGYYSANDGVATEYIITNIKPNLDYVLLNNGLYANKIKEDICEFIYPGNISANSYGGNSSLIKVANKVLLFDTNSASAYSYLKTMFEENNINHLDYVIISHFDNDHRENLESLIIDGFIDRNTKYIHPNCIEEIYGSEVKTWYNNFENLCTTNGIESIVPTENQIINVVYNFSMRFGNLNKTYALANYTTTNQLSMIVEVKHNNFYTLFMGDASKETEKYLYDTDFIKSEINFYNIPHHAIESQCYTPFYNLINPKFAIAQVQNGHYNMNLLTTNQSSALLCEKGCVNYFSFNNNTTIHFIERDGNIECIKGKATPHSGQAYNSINIYCDSINFNANRQDGTEIYPFKDLPQALGMIRDWNNQHIVIKLKQGTYGTAYTGTNTPEKNICNISNRKNYITIEGDNKINTFIENGLTVNNSFNVLIRNVTIKPSLNDKRCAYVLASKVLFVDCNFEGKNTLQFEGTAIYTAISSNIAVTRCKFNNLNTAYYVRGATKLNTYDDCITNLNYFIDFDNNNEINIGKISANSNLSTIGNMTQPDSNNMNILSNPSKYTIDTINKMTGEILLPFKPQNRIYKNLIINYSLKFNGYTTGKGNKIIPFTNITSLLISDFNATSDNKINVFTLVISIIDNRISIVRNTCINIASNGTLTSHSPNNESDNNYGIEITSINLI